MAVSAATVWEIRTGGATTNGGGYVTGASGTDYSQQNSAQYALTGVTSSGSGNTVLSASAATDMVGNIARAVSGTNLVVGFYEVISVVAGVSITFSTNVSGTSIASGAIASGVINIGGAQSSPGLVAAALVAQNIVYMKSGTYTCTSGTQNNVAGPPQILVQNIQWMGYNSSRGDNPVKGSQPVITGSGISNVVLFSADQNGDQVAYVTCDGNNLTGVAGFSITVGIGLQCVALNCKNNGFRANEAYRCCYINCYAEGCSTNGGAFTGAGTLWYCIAINNTIPGFSLSGTAHLIGCISASNTGGSSHGFASTTGGGMFERCIAYANGGDGWNIATNNGFQVIPLINCVSISNTGAAAALSGNNVLVQTFARYNNGSNITGTNRPRLINNEITLTSDPFVGAGSGNFAINNVSGGGASLRSLGYPTTFIGGNTANYLDINAAQHLDSTATNPYSFGYIS